MPVFTIVAGPNGAGKSSYSDIYANGAVIHDADKHKVALQNLHPGLDISDEYLYSHLAECYQTFEGHALLQFNSMLVETNLRDDYLIGRAHYMRSLGYTINMIFVALENTIISKERVKQRVDGNGHRVGVFAIEENFRMGLINLKKHVGLFDNFILATPDLREIGASIQPPKPILRLSAGHIIYYRRYREVWANELAEELIALATK